MTEQVEREQVVQNLAKQIDQVKHFSLRGIEEICHDASIGLLGPQDAIANEFVDDSLFRLLSNNELLAAFAKAGFIPPGTPEAKKELLSVFIDAMQRLDVLQQRAEQRWSTFNTRRRLRLPGRWHQSMLRSPRLRLALSSPRRGLTLPWRKPMQENASTMQAIAIASKSLVSLSLLSEISSTYSEPKPRQPKTTIISTWSKPTSGWSSNGKHGC